MKQNACLILPMTTMSKRDVLRKHANIRSMIAEDTNEKPTKHVLLRMYVNNAICILVKVFKHVLWAEISIASGLDKAPAKNLNSN